MKVRVTVVLEKSVESLGSAALAVSEFRSSLGLEGWAVEIKKEQVLNR